ncbi:hypothetical protein D3C76_355820 [compost metagenome]
MCGCFFVLTTYLYTFAFFTIGREANKDKPIEGANDFFGCFVFLLVFLAFGLFFFVYVPGRFGVTKTTVVFGASMLGVGVIFIFSWGFRVLKGMRR